LLRRQRAADNKVPVLILTAREAIEDRVKGLDGGADDYLVKPFGMMEMVSRVRAVLRRAAPKESNDTLKYLELSVSLSEHTVIACGESVLLTLKEFELLRLFLSHPGMVFTRDQLLSDIWGINYDGETRTVDVHIRTLRQKLGGCGDYIETVRGLGYRIKGQSK
jgi:two-component system alkaline phosphatase synthesis response regulator PhoP